MANLAEFRTFGGPWPWTRVRMTLKFISLDRSHQALSKSNISLWLHWFWLWRPFQSHDWDRQIQSHVTRDPRPISEIWLERNFILVPSFKITCWFPLMILTLGRDRSQIWPDFEFWQARWMTLELILLGRSHRVLSRPHTTLRSYQFYWVSLTAFFANFEVTWHVTDIENPARKKFYIGLWFQNH